MRKLSLLLVLINAWTLSNAQSPITFSASAKAAMITLKKDLHQHDGQLSKAVRDRLPLQRIQGKDYMAVLCKVNPQFNRALANEKGYPCFTQVGKVAGMYIPLEKFNSGFSFNGIDYLEIAERMEPYLNNALVDTRADSVHAGINLPQAYTGKNVLVGICDWGFDYTHPVFYDTTLMQNRILAAWDQEKTVGTPPTGFTYGSVYTDTAQLAAAQADTFSRVSTYHGTHVAGIAGGAGAGTVYKGIGFESNLLFSQMGTNSTASLDAFQWMYNVSKAEGKRLVINNSWGGYRANPLDGTSLLSEAIDAYSDSGVVFIFSAANNGGVNFHLDKDFNNDSVKTRISGFSYASDTLLWGQCITMWGEPGKPFSARLRILNNTNTLMVHTPLFNTATAPAYLDTFMITGVDTIFYRVTTEAAHPLNGRPNMTLDVQNKNLSLRNVLYAEAPTGKVHFWNTRLTIYNSGNWGYAFTSLGTEYTLGNKNYGIGHPATTTQCITVAAHLSNAGIASFSSYGPRMDELPKPDLSAPGQSVRSSLNSFATGTFSPVATVTFNGKPYDFIALSGTSMSGPMVAGGASLLLEANPYMTPWNVKDMLKTTARADSYTGSTFPSVRWGEGKMDLYAAIKGVLIAGVSESNVNGRTIYPNPTTDVLFIGGTIDANDRYTIYSTDGKIVADGALQTTLSLAALPSGMYLLHLQTEEGNQMFRLVKQ